MGRLACVDVPALPLQLLLSRNPDWHGHPVAVVDKDSPNGRLLWVDERAHALRILPGQRYAAALSLSNALRAGVVEPEEIAAGVQRIVAQLRTFTPDIEPGGEEPGVFWLDAGGLGRLFSSASRWARAIHAALGEIGLAGTVVVGFTRFGTYAVARSGAAGVPGAHDRARARRREPPRPGVLVFRTAGDEENAARAVPLDRLGFEPALRDALERLGVTRLGEFLELPAQGLRERFGGEAWRLHRMASGRLWTPLDPVEQEEPLAAGAELERPDADAGRLLFLVKSLLDPLLAELARRQRALRGLSLGLVLDDGSRREETIRPAEPTRDAIQLLDLVRLRLESLRFPSGVVEVSLEVEDDRVPADQQKLWRENPRRDPRAASRALARLRAELGSAAVVRARLTEGHMPEASFAWEPCDAFEPRKAPPAPRRAGAATCVHGADDAHGMNAAGGDDAPAAPLPDAAPPLPGAPLVRRVVERPQPLPPRQHHLRDDGWLIRGDAHGAVTRFAGPFVISGGWWAGPVHRDYHFAETQRGDLMWVYFDRRRRRWFLHGYVQ